MKDKQVEGRGQREVNMKEVKRKEVKRLVTTRLSTPRKSHHELRKKGIEKRKERRERRNNTRISTAERINYINNISIT